MSSLKMKGFTLAEVLVTLGIIGVIAAMTIPALAMNYQDKVFESRLKKVYSIAANACERMMTDDNVSTLDETTVYSSLGTSDASIALKRYFKVTSVGNNGTMKLSDGSELTISQDNDGFLFHTDLNGTSAPPNTAGRDIFEFRFDKNGDYSGPQEFVSPQKYTQAEWNSLTKDQKTAAQEAYSDAKATLNKVAALSDAEYCFDSVINNDWKLQKGCGNTTKNISLDTQGYEYSNYSIDAIKTLEGASISKHQ